MIHMSYFRMREGKSAHESTKTEKWKIWTENQGIDQNEYSTYNDKDFN